MPLCLLCAQTRHSSQIVRRESSKSSANRVRQAPRLANTPGQPLKASCASCAQGLAPPALCPRCKSPHFRQHSTPCPRSCSTVNRIILNSPSRVIVNLPSRIAVNSPSQIILNPHVHVPKLAPFSLHREFSLLLHCEVSLARHCELSFSPLETRSLPLRCELSLPGDCEFPFHVSKLAHSLVIVNSLPRHCEERCRRGNLPLHCPPSSSPESSAIPRIFSKEKGVVYLKNY